MTTMRLEMSDATEPPSPTSWKHVVDSMRNMPSHEVPALWVRLMARLSEHPPVAPIGMAQDEWMQICRSQFGVLYQHALNDAGLSNEASHELCSNLPAALNDMRRALQDSIHKQTDFMSTMVEVMRDGHAQPMNLVDGSPSIQIQLDRIEESLQTLERDKVGALTGSLAETRGIIENQNEFLTAMLQLIRDDNSKINEIDNKIHTIQTIMDELRAFQDKIDQMPSAEKVTEIMDTRFEALTKTLQSSAISDKGLEMYDGKINTLLETFQFDFKQYLAEQLEEVKNTNNRVRDGAVDACERHASAVVEMHKLSQTQFVAQFLQDQAANTEKVVEIVVDKLQEKWKADISAMLQGYVANGAMVSAQPSVLEPLTQPATTISKPDKEKAELSVLQRVARRKNLIALLEVNPVPPTEIEAMLNLFWTGFLMHKVDFRENNIAAMQESNGKGSLYIIDGSKFYINPVIITLLLRPHFIHPIKHTDAALKHPFGDFVKDIQGRITENNYIPISLFVLICNKYCIARDSEPYSAFSSYPIHTTGVGEIIRFCYSNNKFDLNWAKCKEFFPSLSGIEMMLKPAPDIAYDSDAWFENELKSSLSDQWLSSMARQTWIASERERPQSPL